jgi:Major Facilitator Superfamily
MPPLACPVALGGAPARGDMASRTESRTVNLAGLVQGIVLVTFPAASTIFTSPTYYGLSITQYGDMFLPQVVLAIVAALAGAALARRIGLKRVYLLGLSASLIAMGLLIGSALVKSDQAVAFPLLLIATAFVGTGFGLTVPALNTYTAAFHPQAVDSAVLVLNALLGLGTVLAPVFVAIFVGLGFWWGLPVTSAVLLVALLIVSMRLPLTVGSQPPVGGRPSARAIRVPFAGTRGVLGDGDRRPGSVRCRQPLGAAQAYLPATAVCAGSDLLHHRQADAWRCRGSDRRVRPRRPGLLRAAAADNQLRRGGAHHDYGRPGQRRDRVLPVRLWHRGVRCKPAAEGGDQPVGDIRRDGDRGGRDGGAVVPGSAATSAVSQ